MTKIILRMNALPIGRSNNFYRWPYITMDAFSITWK